MKPVLHSTLALLLLACHGHGEEAEEPLVVVRQEQKYFENRKPADVVIEWLAAPEDVDESEGWHPDSNQLPAPMKKIIEVAYATTEVPTGKRVYLKPEKYVSEPVIDDPFSASRPPEFRGADLRRVSENLWYWEIYFAFHLDRSIESQASIRGGDLILSTKVLPNGGIIKFKERKMTARERITYGLDPDLESPFSTGTADRKAKEQ